MSQEVGQNELQAKTRQLMDGPLKHIKAAVLAAALVPLASVLATPASAQTQCGSGGVCGFVFNDANNNGILDAGDTPIEGIAVTICQLCDGTDTVTAFTGVNGYYSFGVPNGPTTLAVLIPTGTQTSPVVVGGNAGVSNGSGYSVAVVTATFNTATTNFGFSDSPKLNPGTGTPGYWKNHPEAWPVQSITIGGVFYSKDAAIAALGKITKDKTTTMFSSLVSAKLNLLIGNDGSCVSSAIANADAWMALHHLGSNVLASSDAWKIGEPWHQTMDAYNNGLLCVQHRQ